MFTSTFWWGDRVNTLTPPPNGYGHEIYNNREGEPIGKCKSQPKHLCEKTGQVRKKYLMKSRKQPIE